MAKETDLRWSDLEPEEETLLKELGVPIGGRPVCPPLDLLQAFHSGALSGALRRHIGGHVEHCRVCQILSRDFAAMDVPLTKEEDARIRARVFKAHSGRQQLRRWQFLWLLIPAVAAAVLAVIAIWMHVGRQNHARQLASSAPPPQSLAAGSPVFTLEKPPVALSVPLLMRGRQAYAAALSSALEPYEAGDYSSAVKRLDPLARKYPQRAEALFYLGVSELFEANYGGAAESLKRASAVARGSLASECRWYLALAELHAGQPANAAATLEILCEAAGVYQKRACAGLKELSSKNKASFSR